MSGHVHVAKKGNPQVHSPKENHQQTTLVPTRENHTPAQPKVNEDQLSERFEFQEEYKARHPPSSDQSGVP